MKKYSIINYIYIIIIIYLFYNIICYYEYFDNIIFTGKKYINSINDIDKNVINNNIIINNIINNDINLDIIKNNMNKDKKKIIYNLSNRPFEYEKKTYEDIKLIVIKIINLMKKDYNNLYLRNVIDINQEKIDNQAKLSFILIIDNNNNINLKIYVEFLYEKLFENQEVFNNNDNKFNDYLNKLEFIN
jgi:hypothetical protein